MEFNKTFSMVSIFTVTVVCTLGVKTGNLIWTKIIEPRVTKIK
jgi:hypothetical protein